MTIQQISKIQLRRGPEIDLPGYPSNTIPLDFTEGLAAGELAFAVDTGRLFIGSDPAQGSVNYKRIEFPYRNIEVLTEAARGTLLRIHEGFTREQTSGSFFSTTLDPSSEWMDVQLLDKDQNVRSVIFSGLDLLGSIDYFAFVGSRPLEGGKITFASDPHDLSVTVDVSRSVSIGGPSPLEFRAIFQNDPQGYVLQYLNDSSDRVYLFFRTTRVSLPDVLNATDLGLDPNSLYAEIKNRIDEVAFALQTESDVRANSDNTITNTLTSFQANILSQFNDLATMNIGTANAVVNIEAFLSGENGIVFNTQHDNPFVIQYDGMERVRINGMSVGVGTNAPSESAALDVQSTTQGVRFPNMTSNQRTAISGLDAGLIVFDTDLQKLCVYTGSGWEAITSTPLP
jgi:hypothetical protein